MVRIGEDSAEQIGGIPPKIQVLRTVRAKYAESQDVRPASSDVRRWRTAQARARSALLGRGRTRESVASAG